MYFFLSSKINAKTANKLFISHIRFIINMNKNLVIGDVTITKHNSNKFSKKILLKLMERN
ncbi:MAG: hypothetical protein AB1466_05810 [Actinomycetota bacterium]